MTDFEHILVYNIEYYRNLFYNMTVILNKGKMWLVVLSSKKFKELFTTLDYVVDEKNKLIRDVVNMFSDGFRLDDWKKEYSEALNQLVTIATVEEAVEEKEINTIKAMLNKNFSLKTISEITGKSIKEIKNISKTIME